MSLDKNNNNKKLIFLRKKPVVLNCANPAKNTEMILMGLLFQTFIMLSGFSAYDAQTNMHV